MGLLVVDPIILISNFKLIYLSLKVVRVIVKVVLPFSAISPSIWSTLYSAKTVVSGYYGSTLNLAYKLLSFIKVIYYVAGFLKNTSSNISSPYGSIFTVGISDSALMGRENIS